MAENILKKLVEDILKWTITNKDKEVENEGRAIISRLLKDPALLLEVVEKIRHIQDDADSLIANNDSLSSLDESLKHLRNVRTGYFKQLKKEPQDKESRDHTRKLFKDADSVIQSSTDALSNVVHGLLEKRYDNILDEVLQEKTARCTNLGDRIIKIGAEEYKYSGYIAKLLSYQHKFYSYSKNPDVKTLEKYKFSADNATEYINQLENSDNVIKLEFKLNPRMPLKFIEADIDEFASNIKFMAEMLDSFYSSNNISRLDLDVQNIGDEDVIMDNTFNRWDRYLKICKLNQEKGYAIENDLTPKIDSICRDISSEFSWYTTSDLTDRRKTVKADYQSALKLIAKAEKGSLLT